MTEHKVNPLIAINSIAAYLSGGHDMDRGYGNSLRHAYAAVAELVEAVKPFAHHTHGKTIDNPITTHTVEVRDSDLHRLLAALAPFLEGLSQDACTFDK